MSPFTPLAFVTLSSNVLYLAHSATSTLAFWLLFGNTCHVLASGPLHRLSFLLGLLFQNLHTCLHCSLSPPPSLCSDVSFLLRHSSPLYLMPYPEFPSPYICSTFSSPKYYNRLTFHIVYLFTIFISCLLLLEYWGQEAGIFVCVFSAPPKHPA